MGIGEVAGGVRREEVWDPGTNDEPEPDMER